MANKNLSELQMNSDTKTASLSFICIRIICEMQFYKTHYTHAATNRLGSELCPSRFVAPIIFIFEGILLREGAPVPLIGLHHSTRMKPWRYKNKINGEGEEEVLQRISFTCDPFVSFENFSQVLDSKPGQIRI